MVRLGHRPVVARRTTLNVNAPPNTSFDVRGRGAVFLQSASPPVIERATIGSTHLGMSTLSARCRRRPAHTLLAEAAVVVCEDIVSLGQPSAFPPRTLPNVDTRPQLRYITFCAIILDTVCVLVSGLPLRVRFGPNPGFLTHVPLRPRAVARCTLTRNLP